MRSIILIMVAVMGVSIVAHAGERMEEKFDSTKVIWKKRTREKVIAITIDDCYNVGLVRKAMREAARRNVKLTFFPTGDAVKSAPGLWREVRAAGHEIELHTQTHHSMETLSEDGQFEQYRKNIDAVRAAVGQDIRFRFVRPPGGCGVFGYECQGGCMPSYRRSVERLSRYNRAHIDIAMWGGDSLFVRGHATGSAYVLEYFERELMPGKIFLYHTRAADMAVLGEMIDYAIKRGYHLGSLKELMEL